MRSGQNKQGEASLPCPELPDHLWSTIAGILGQEEWARVSGTCKTFKRTQLLVIKAETNRVDELLWLSNRWKLAKTLTIYLSDSIASADAEAFQQIAAAGALWPRNLRHLSLHAQVDYDSSKSTAMPQWVQQVISNAHEVDALLLRCVQPVPVAFTTALKHLAVSAMGSAMPASWACIESLRCLETLHVAVPTHNTSSDVFSLPTPPMRLLCCSKLRALHVRNVVPADLAVPAGCRVTFEGIVLGGPVEMHSAFMRGIVGILQACSVFSIGVREVSHLKIIENALGQPLPNLEELEVRWTGASENSAPFALEICGDMPRLTRLSIRNGEAPVSVDVTSPVHLRSLLLEGDSNINISATPDTMASLFCDIEQVEVQWGRGHAPGLISGLGPLRSMLLTTDGYTLECSHQEDQGKFEWFRVIGGEVVRWQPSPFNMTNPYEDMYMTNPRYAGHPYSCLSILKCGACEECLKQDGLLQM